MKNIFLSLSVLCLLPAAAAAQVQVVSKTPYGPIADMNAAQAVAATFSRPMTALTSAEKMGEACPLEVFEIGDELTPENYNSFTGVKLEDFKDLRPLAGRCRWQGTQTVTFEPAEPLRTATLYGARIKAGFSFGGDALTDDAEWFFETVRPAITQTFPYDEQRWLPTDTLFFAAFNQPMSSARARDFIRLEERGPDGSVGEALAGVRLAKPEEIKKLWPHPWQNVSTGTVLAVRPASRLKVDHAYTLVFGQGLLAAGGNLGLAAGRSIDLEPYYSFGVKELTRDGCLPGDFKLGFSNPVKLSELYKHMSVDPSTAMPPMPPHAVNNEGWRDHQNRTVWLQLPEGLLKPETKYSFKLSPELTDIFGNKLGEEVSFELGPMDYCAYWTMPTGFGVLEGYLPARHPFTAVNAGPLSVLKGLVGEENLIPFYKGRMEDETLLASGEAKTWDPAQGLRNSRLVTFLDHGDIFGPEEGGFGYLRAPGMGGYPLRALDNITRIGVTLKASQDATLIWTSFLKTGRAAPGVPVEIRSEENKVLWTGVTDKSGFADAPGWLKLGITDWPRWQRPALWVFARHKNGTAVMNTSWTGGVEPWRFSVNFDNYPRPRRYAAALFTERGVYRPGETVDIKAIGRRLAGGDWEALDFPVAQVSVTDSRGNRVFKTTVPVNAEFSSFDYAYALPQAAPTGVWSVEVSEPYEDDASSARAVEGDEEGEYREYRGKERPFLFSESFRVEEFKPAVFEVKARSLEESYLSGGKFRAAVEGWYLFGAPMAGSRADWTLRLTGAHYAPPGKEDFRFGGDWRGEHMDQLAGSGSLELDGKGKGAVEVQLEKAYRGSGNALRASLEAGVTDPERQRLFGRASAWVHKANLYFGVKASGGFVNAGKPWSADIIAVRPDGSPAAGLSGEGRMIKRQWLSARRAGLGGRLEWVTEVKDTTVSTFTFTASASTETWTYTPAEGGYYIFTVSGADEEGRKAETSFSFYVFGGGDAWWAREDSDIIELVSEKYDYKPGETARIMVKSPYDEAQALVTVEREGVLDRWLTTTRGGADFIEVPIKEKYLPNAYVSVMLVKGRAADQKFSADGEDDLSKPQAKFGYAAFNVSPAGRRLALELKADKADYRPGQEVRLALEVKDEAGRPSAAELTVFAVDEGVLALTGYPTPDAFAAFYGPRPLNILTADSRLHVIGQRSYGEKGEARGGGGGGAGLAGIDLRADFRPTAYWNPAVKAGPDGKAAVSFKLPDSLTRFRLMAVANSARRFGSGETAVTVSKPLMLRPSMPRLARVGDAFDCGAVVHNYTSTAAAVEVSLETAGEAVLVKGEDLRPVTVDGGKAAELTWACAAEKPGETVFKFRAKAGGETDGLEWKLPVKTWEPLEYAATSGVSENSAVEALLRPYAGAAGELAVEISPTALTGLNEGARYLLEYPYGCLEQRLSRSMPVITGAALIETFGLGSLGTLKAEVQKVLDRLPDYQAAQGGFRYWTGSWGRPDPYLTAYVLEAAALAAKEGYRVDPGVLKRAADWLEAYLGAAKTDWAYPYSVSEDYAARAYAVYALALNGRSMGAYFNRLYTVRDQVPYLAKAYMAKAAKLLGFDLLASKKLTAEIMAQARYSPTQLHFEDAEPMPWIHNSAVKTTAVMLDALLAADGGFAGDEKAVRWLTTEKKNRGRWRSTQENAWALRAFQGFYRRYEKDEPDFLGTVTLAGAENPLLSRYFKGRQLTSAGGRFGFDKVFGEGEEAKVLFNKSGIGRLYYTARLGFVPAKRDRPAAEGLEISREMRPMDGGKVFKAGARAIVTLTVKTPQDRTFVAVNDPVPAGFEIVNTEFAVESAEDARALAAKAERGSDWGGFERAERYDDRMLIFADYLTAGTHKYSYVVQATGPGSYYWPSALVEGMYEPEVFGRTTGGSVEIAR